MKKNFSIAKIYSDLQKYEANLAGIKESRIKKQSSGPSLHHRPPSSHQRNFQTTSNTLKFGNSHTKNKNEYLTIEKDQSISKGNYFDCDYEIRNFSNNTSVLKEKWGKNEEIKKEYSGAGSGNGLTFNRNDELQFLTQCSRIYNLKDKQNKGRKGKQEDSIKILLAEINKRDRIYESVVSKLGSENVEENLKHFFQNYERMRKIIDQFKKMSKLSIQNDEELYQFLINQDEQKSTRLIQMEALNTHI